MGCGVGKITVAAVAADHAAKVATPVAVARVKEYEDGENAEAMMICPHYA